MKTFVCRSCGQPVFFENTRCTRCGAALGFLPDQMRLSALVDAGDGIWTAAPPSPSTRTRPPGFFRDQQPESQHGSARPLSLRPASAGHRQDGLCPQDDPRGSQTVLVGDCRRSPITTSTPCLRYPLSSDPIDHTRPCPYSPASRRAF
ncbi:MAG TPA: zinc-ribbon domain-containing protein [Thiocapsa sp.]|nr:zinc-ribbon domain-containing protein [Thiocapsa sp.]HSO83525.1 zinc-ribbon domain-containing protein [Thiocapsa sp.]